MICVIIWFVSSFGPFTILLYVTRVQYGIQYDIGMHNNSTFFYYIKISSP